jgi:hypothetical protein
MAKVSYTTATLAAEVDTTPKELRKFLRSEISGIESVGKGGRYTIELTATQLAATKKKFAKWGADLAAKREAAKIADAPIEDAPQGPTESDEVEALAMIDGPTDADLEEIDIEDLEA